MKSIALVHTGCVWCKISRCNWIRNPNGVAINVLEDERVQEVILVDVITFPILTQKNEQSSR